MRRVECSLRRSAPRVRVRVRGRGRVTVGVGVTVTVTVRVRVRVRVPSPARAEYKELDELRETHGALRRLRPSSRLVRVRG